MRRTPLLIEGMDDAVRRAERAHASQGSPASRQALVNAHIRAGNHDEAVRIHFAPDLQFLGHTMRAAHDPNIPASRRRTRIEIFQDTASNLSTRAIPSFLRKHGVPISDHLLAPVLRRHGQLGSRRINDYLGRALTTDHFGGDHSLHRRALAYHHNLRPIDVGPGEFDLDRNQFYGHHKDAARFTNDVNRLWGESHEVRPLPPQAHDPEIDRRIEVASKSNRTPAQPSG